MDTLYGGFAGETHIPNTIDHLEMLPDSKWCHLSMVLEEPRNNAQTGSINNEHVTHMAPHDKR